MIPSSLEPFENGKETTVNWKSKSNRVSFKRDNKTYNLVFAKDPVVNCDRIFFETETGDWECEVQAMTENKFHLHVLPKNDKTMILFSGVVTKTKSFLFF
ncbi:hypothetical protein P3G55_16355 [Leptospira sp. 96542]|nr:hypothetical protein [Leptospira sp. 96542]